MAIPSNLDQSRRIVQGSYHDYWLNPDGTVTEKTFIGRIIRWAQNYFFNTTLCDISSAFQSVVRSYIRLHNDFVLHVGVVTTDDLLTQAKRVCFVAQFLASRSQRLLACPQIMNRVQGCLNMLPIPDEAKSIAYLQDLDLDTEDPQVKALHMEDAVLPPLSSQVLSLRPPPIEFVLDDNAKLTGLLDRYDELAPNREPPPENPVILLLWNIRNWWREGQEKKVLREMCKCIAKCDKNKYNHPQRKEAYKQAELFLKRCNHLLKDPTIGADKRWQALNEIVVAASECVPRWLNEAEKQCDFLAETMVPVQALMLHWKTLLVQDWIQETVPDMEHTNHYLNAIAGKWGDVFGLGGDIAALDMYKEPLHDPELEQLKEALQQAWRERAVSAFKARINVFYRPEIFDTLKDAVERAGVSEPVTFVSDHYYDAQGKIKDAGVIRLLRETLTHPVLAE